MSHDDYQRSSPIGDNAGRADELQPEPRPTSGNALEAHPEAVHRDGVGQREPAPRSGSGDGNKEERLVALIRQEVTQVFLEAQPQLHSPEALEGYKLVDPSMPGRILAMAEREQKAQIDSDLLPIRAEAYSYKFAVTMVSSLPMALIILGVILVLAGKDSAGYVAAMAGIIGGGAQIIGLVRPTRQGRSRDAGAHTARRGKQ